MMIRSFLPIGQGAFYCEEFRGCNGEEKINIIYDCGSSTDVKLVEKQIRSNFEKDERIHALFISHLDDDHINGIPFLLKYCNVEKIFFPLLSCEDAYYLKLYNYIKCQDGESFAAAFIENPYEALEKIEKEKKPQLYAVVEEYSDRSSTWRVERIQSGTDISKDLIANNRKKFECLKNWKFIPYNFRQSSRIKELQNKLTELFGKEIINDDLQGIWEKGTEEQRKKIKEAYKNVKGSFNTNSMTLYSGSNYPCYGRVLKNDCFCRCCGKRVDNCGCLYLGDYDASGKQKWKNLYEAYETYWNDMDCIQIPHHGSKNNYNKELGKFNAHFIISAGLNNHYLHPHALVIRDLLFNENVPFVVTEKQSSAVVIYYDYE